MRGRLVVGPNGVIRVVVEGDQIVFDDPILFATDSDEILPESFPLIDKIAETMVEHSEIRSATIEGHTDDTGSSEHNHELSQRRAAAVVEALRSRSVTTPLVAAGIGEDRPLCTDDNDACHQRNRRVEIHIIQTL
ncbi:MAG: outer membrane protein OmpA-like peptidoglycan-associated protein [Polyangiales bacterium]|jgi:outer membrane protein OmpA-like peptidoglycan-associated protein